MSGPASPPPAPHKAGWLRELRGLLFIIAGVVAVHSAVAKPFYIASESMMPGLVVGDQLIVSKYPYGWSWASASFHLLPRTPGRLLGAMPERGDVVIVVQPSTGHDLIKRVIGLPGDRIEMSAGILYLNGKAIPREPRRPAMIPVDANSRCRFDGFGDFLVTGADGRAYCRLPVVRETLPNGRSYDTIDLGASSGDTYAPVIVPKDHVFLMGDNRDYSADSRFPTSQLGLGGPVPWQDLGGRAEFITFSLDGSASYWNPVSWFESMRGERAGTSLRPPRSSERAPAPEARPAES